MDMANLQSGNTRSRTTELTFWGCEIHVTEFEYPLPQIDWGLSIDRALNEPGELRGIIGMLEVVKIRNEKTLEEYDESVSLSKL